MNVIVIVWAACVLLSGFVATIAGSSPKAGYVEVTREPTSLQRVSDTALWVSMCLMSLGMLVSFVWVALSVLFPTLFG